MAQKHRFWELEDEECTDDPKTMSVIPVEEIYKAPEKKPPSTESTLHAGLSSPSLTHGLTLGPQTWAMVLQKLVGVKKQLKPVRIATSCSGSGSPVLSLEASLP